LNLNKIQEIYLSNNQFSDAGMKVICDFINKNESIKKIEIRNCQITIKGLRELKNIKKKSSIKEIDILKNIRNYMKNMK
jgi:Ran GTPase-activating protein (RanGAP) involved in mRNA processing and transport